VEVNGVIPVWTAVKTDQCNTLKADVKLNDIYENSLDVRGSVRHSTYHKEKSNKMQKCIKMLLFHIYIKLNMFWATNRPSSEA
jgi:hypothetical protein